eukprot:1366933-Pyramimonas_sp.AAC.1
MRALSTLSKKSIHSLGVTMVENEQPRAAQAFGGEAVGGRFLVTEARYIEQTSGRPLRGLLSSVLRKGMHVVGVVQPGRVYPRHQPPERDAPTARYSFSLSRASCNQ